MNLFAKPSFPPLVPEPALLGLDLLELHWMKQADSILLSYEGQVPKRRKPKWKKPRQ